MSNRQRVKRAVESFESAAATIGPIEKDMSLFAITRGQFSMLDAILHCLHGRGSGKRKRDREAEAGQEAEAEAGQVRGSGKRDRSDIAKSGDFSACPYCQ